jgi:hypothetical protein
MFRRGIHEVYPIRDPTEHFPVALVYLRRREVELGLSFARGGKKAFPHEERRGRNTHRRVMVKSSPSSSFVLIEAYLILEFLVVPLDAPTKFGNTNQFLELKGVRQRR